MAAYCHFCFALGFWVAAARPRDPRAWFLLFLLLGFSCFLNARLETWGPVSREFSVLYRLLMLSSLPVWLLWLGVLARITGAADQFVAGAKQNDDMTLIVARVVG